MAEPCSIVEHVDAFLCDDREIPRYLMAVRLGWSTVAPLEIKVLLAGPENDVSWRISRNTLDRALAGQPTVCDGDISIRRLEQNSCITIMRFSSPDGSAVVATCTKPLRRFLDATCEMIAPHSKAEAMAIDHALCSMLAQVIQ